MGESNGYITRVFGTVNYGTKFIDDIENNRQFNAWCNYKSTKCKIPFRHTKNTCMFHHGSDWRPRRCRRYALGLNCDKHCGRMHEPLSDEFITRLPCYFDKLPADIIRTIASHCAEKWYDMVRVSKRFRNTLGIECLRIYPQFDSLVTKYNIRQALLAKCRQIIAPAEHPAEIEMIVDNIKAKLSPYLDAIAYIEANGSKIDETFIDHAFKYNGLYVEDLPVETILDAIDRNLSSISRFEIVIDNVIRLAEIHKYHTAGRARILERFIIQSYYRKAKTVIMGDVKFCSGFHYRVCVLEDDTVYSINADRLSKYEYGTDYSRYVQPQYLSISLWDPIRDSR